MSRTHGHEPLWLKEQRFGVEEHRCNGNMELCGLNPNSPFAPVGAMPRCSLRHCAAEPLQRLTVQCWHSQAVIPMEGEDPRGEFHASPSRIPREASRLEPLKIPGAMSHRYIWDGDTGERIPDVAGELPRIESLPSCDDRGDPIKRWWAFQDTLPAPHLKKVGKEIRLWAMLPPGDDDFHLQQASPGAPARYYHEYDVAIHDATRCGDCAFMARYSCHLQLTDEQRLYQPKGGYANWEFHYSNGPSPRIQRRRMDEQLHEYRALWNSGVGEDDLPQI